MLFSIYAWMASLLITFLLGVPTILLTMILGPTVIHHATRIWSRSICFLCKVKVEIKGIENINPTASQVFLSNHQGFFDIFAIAGHFNVPFVWIAKKNLFFVPLVGWGMSMGGHIALNRSSPRQAIKSLYRAVAQLKKGKSILIFPEGTRTNNGNLGDFKKGSLFLVMKSKVPVVPVSITGSFGILKKGEMRITPGTVKITIHPPIDTQSLTTSDEIRFLTNVRGTIKKNIEGV